MNVGLDLQPTSAHDAPVSATHSTGAASACLVLYCVMQIHSLVTVCGQQALWFSDPSPKLLTFSF